MRTSNGKKTIRQWERDCGIVLMELIGVTASENKLLKLKMSRKQFKQVASECTVELVATSGIPSEKKVHKRPKVTKKLGFLLFVFTMPALATLIFGWLYQWIARWIRIKWYIPCGLLFVALIDLLMQPVTALIAGPGYVWYQICNFVVHKVTTGLAFGGYYLLHRSLNLMSTSVPLFSTIHVHGYALNLYFHLSEAIASSLYWAVIIVCTKNLFKRINTMNKPKDAPKRLNRSIGNQGQGHGNPHSELSGETQIWVP